MLSLLDTSVRHSPHFDWVVAHLGSCFPQTVTSRVLSLGLRFSFNTSWYFDCHVSSNREFAAAASTNPGSAELSLSKIPKLVSVVNILSHLGTTHPIQLEEAVQEAVQVKLKIFSQLLTTSCPGEPHQPFNPIINCSHPFPPQLIFSQVIQ